jgi:2-phospho-L-lactate guanylyltransferase (CobY/MobA/RfbA family)
VEVDRRITSRSSMSFRGKAWRPCSFARHAAKNSAVAAILYNSLRLSTPVDDRDPCGGLAFSLCDLGMGEPELD